MLTSLLILASCGPKAEYLEEIAQMGNIQKNAAIKADTTVLIQAPLQMIWIRILKVDDWPGWYKGISAAEAPEEYKAGAAFSWTENGTSFDSKIVVLQPGKMLSWIDRSFGTKGIMVWRLEYVDAGHTIITLRRSIDGPLAGFFFSEPEEKEFLGNWIKSLQYSIKDPGNDDKN
jgi:hypothetical protein